MRRRVRVCESERYTYYSEGIALPGARGGKSPNVRSRGPGGAADCASEEQRAKFGRHCEVVWAELAAEGDVLRARCNSTTRDAIDDGS